MTKQNHFTLEHSSQSNTRVVKIQFPFDMSEKEKLFLNLMIGFINQHILDDKTFTEVENDRWHIKFRCNHCDTVHEINKE